MKISTRSQNAIQAMLALALNQKAGVLRLSDLADQQGVSVALLEQVFYSLRHASLVEGVRGPGGGYRLARATTRITLADIIDATEPEEAGGSAKDAVLQTVWDDLNTRFRDWLEGITLADLIDQHSHPVGSFAISETASLIARMFPVNSGACAHVC